MWNETMLLRTMWHKEPTFSALWLLSGETYLYDESVACAGRPEGKSLEVCSRFNYLTLNDEDAAIWGGEQKISPSDSTIILINI